jgi:hypothetical protein
MMEKRPAALRCPAGLSHAVCLCSLRVLRSRSFFTQRPAGDGQTCPLSARAACHWPPRRSGHTPCALMRRLHPGQQEHWYAAYCEREARRSVADRAGRPGGWNPMQHSGAVQDGAAGRRASSASMLRLAQRKRWVTGQPSSLGDLALDLLPPCKPSLCCRSRQAGGPAAEAAYAQLWAGAHAQGLVALWNTGEAARHGAVHNAQGARRTGRERQPQAPWQARTQQRGSLVRAQPPAALHAAVGRPGRRRGRRVRRAGRLRASGRAVCAGVFLRVLHTRSKVLSSCHNK